MIGGAVGCFVALIALVAPRIVLFLIWLVDGAYLTRAYGTWVWPLLGFFFLPLTTIAYAWATNSGFGMSGLGLVAVVLAFLVDVGILGNGGRHANRSRR